MGTKYTPGPWSINRKPAGYIYQIGPILAEKFAGDIGLEVSEANARLIAATPELMKVAHMVLSWWEKHQFDTTGERGEFNVYDEEPEFVTASRAVITKVTTQNACADVDTATLEENKAPFSALRKERDELMSALRRSSRYIESPCADNRAEVIEQINSAIAKATGSA